MLLVNIDYLPGRELEVLGIVKGTIVQSKNFGKDFMAGMKTLVGGEITGYTEMLVEARQLATKRMVDEAEALGAAVFYAGTKKSDSGEVLTAGGRVLGVTATAPSLEEAIEKAYAAAKPISFQDMHFRSDIGKV